MRRVFLKPNYDGALPVTSHSIYIEGRCQLNTPPPPSAAAPMPQPIISRPASSLHDLLAGLLFSSPSFSFHAGEGGRFKATVCAGSSTFSYFFVLTKRSKTLRCIFSSFALNLIFLSAVHLPPSATPPPHSSASTFLLPPPYPGTSSLDPLGFGPPSPNPPPPFLS